MSIKTFVVAAAVAVGTFGIADRADAQWRRYAGYSYPTYNYSYPTYSAYSYLTYSFAGGGLLVRLHVPELLQLGCRDHRLHHTVLQQQLL